MSKNCFHPSDWFTCRGGERRCRAAVGHTHRGQKFKVVEGRGHRYPKEGRQGTLLTRPDGQAHLVSSVIQPLTNYLDIGGKAIMPHLIEIVKMLLPPSHDGTLVSRSQLFGPTTALYNLCNNGESGVVLS